MSSFTLSSAEISAANATGVPASLSVESSHLSVAFCCGSVFCAVCAKNATKCPGCDASVEEVMGIMGTGCWVSVSRVDDVLAIAPLDISTPSNFPFPHYLQRIARSLLISPMHIVDEIEDALLAFPLVLSAGMKVAVDALDDVRKSALREEVENAVRKIHEFRKLFLPKKSRKKRKKKNNGNSSSVSMIVGVTTQDYIDLTTTFIRHRTRRGALISDPTKLHFYFV